MHSIRSFDLDKAERNTKILFRRKPIFTKLEEIIASDIRVRNEKLSEKYIHKFIDKLGLDEEIPNGEY